MNSKQLLLLKILTRFMNIYCLFVYSRQVWKHVMSKYNLVPHSVLASTNTWYLWESTIITISTTAYGHQKIKHLVDSLLFALVKKMKISSILPKSCRHTHTYILSYICAYTYLHIHVFVQFCQRKSYVWYTYHT